ncbi:class I SAM-dependent methyltransferase [Halapricum hydrolyticum]|uniref:Class I SAM-dependent methyltransferase n=1 Tax=Halapricum hydrolyticum TaxID=2979991 RepID=A0AAE3LJ76_9EURY|nr:class I SAM-dependent methyltransferase [Halapricum hydrolyticum]MCU4717888.1 class I SAM-dependent methyltransferase [Halapricum hydrolyticum]MCU4727053.1 class I SAM-dependent methyltransferase [Halapricum hydrolyticum]
MGSNAIYDRHHEVFLLWACRETGVFDALFAGKRRSDVIAEHAGITDRASEIVLEALVDSGYVRETEDGYEPTEELRGFDPETPPLERGILPHRVDSLENYIRLPETMRSGESPEPTADGFKNYMGAMASIRTGTLRAIVTAAEHAHPRPERVLDVGGGPGRFGAEFARRGADVTLLDQREVLDLLDDHHAKLGLDTVEGDARESLPEGFDLVFSARMTVSLSLSGISEYFGNVFEALEPGGTFVAAEWVQGRAEVAERFGVHMLSMSDVGNTYTEDEYLSALESAGFADPEIRDVPDTRFQLVVGRKPE